MADVTHSLPQQRPILHMIGAPFRAILRGVLAYAEANTYVKEVDALNRLSDEALAKRGLTRDDIVRHVFRHHLVY